LQEECASCAARPLHRERFNSSFALALPACATPSRRKHPLVRGRCCAHAARRASAHQPALSAGRAARSAAAAWSAARFGAGPGRSPRWFPVVHRRAASSISIPSSCPIRSRCRCCAGLLVNDGGVFTDLRSAVIGALRESHPLRCTCFRLATGKEGMGSRFQAAAAIGAGAGAVLPLTSCFVLHRSRGGNCTHGLRPARPQRAIPFGPNLGAAGSSRCSGTPDHRHTSTKFIEAVHVDSRRHRHGKSVVAACSPNAGRLIDTAIEAPHQPAPEAGDLIPDWPRSFCAETCASSRYRFTATPVLANRPRPPLPLRCAVSRRCTASHEWVEVLG